MLRYEHKILVSSDRSCQEKKCTDKSVEFSDILPKLSKLHFALSILLALQCCRFSYDGGQRKRFFFAPEEVTSSRT